MTSPPPLRAQQVIYLHADAPHKPALGQACNGCGVCCATEPCPVGMIISRRRRGTCVALQWSTPGSLYRCGLVANPRALWPRLPSWALPLVAALAQRWISAASGCDATLEVNAGPYT